MGEEMFSKGATSPPKTLNTKGCCFICLQVVDFKAELGTEAAQSRREAVSLNCINRHLKIHTEKLSGTTTANLQDGKETSKKPEVEEINADLCESCKGIAKRFSSCFLALEKAQMEVNYCLNRIHQQISEAAQKPELVQNYSKRMTSDPETLTQLVFVDKLRKEIAAKSLKRGSIKRPSLELKRVKIKKVVVSPPVPQPPLEDFSLDGFEAEQLSDDFEGESASNLEEAVKKTEPFCTSNAYLQTHKMKKACVSTSRSARTTKLGTRYNFNHETRKYNCAICKKEFENVKAAWTHYDFVHADKKFKCDNCNKVYNHRSYFNRHKVTCKEMLPLHLAANQARITDPRFKFDCSVCGKRFRKKLEQKRHLIVHLNQRNHECDICKKRYKSSAILSSHKKVVHLKLKIYCKTCNKGFGYSSHSQLKAHERKCVVKVVNKTEKETD